MIHVFFALLTSLFAYGVTMLNWWLGRPVGESANPDGDVEPPETPAPIFAARALKSAIFGTPAPPHDDTIFDLASEKSLKPTMAAPKPQERDMSPVRPPGILMTPGTATARRKSVSFGRDVVDKDVVAVKQGRQTRQSRSNSLTRALEIAKEEKMNGTSSGRGRDTFDRRPLSEFEIEAPAPKSTTVLQSRSKTDYLIKPDLLEELARDDPEGDMTMDLNQPHSQSGRYWKSEFHKYHEEAQIQMRKLLQYKEGAKDFAMKKDAEVLELNQKLKEEQRRVHLLESKVIKLSNKIDLVGSGGHGYDKDSAEVVKELAKQTALVAHYKKQAEEAKLTQKDSTNGRKGTHDVLQVTEEKDSSPHVKLLREEIIRLQRSLTTTEKENTKLQEENKKLVQDLSHSSFKIEKLTERVEKRRVSFDEMRQKKDDALDQLQKTYDSLKEKAKSQRRDAEQLLKQRHDQVVELKKEIAAGRQLEKKVEELQESIQKQTNEHSQAVANYEIQIAELKRDVILGADDGVDLRASIQRDPHLSSTLAKLEGESPLRKRESLIPLASNSISRPLKAAARYSRSETPSSSPSRKDSEPLSEVVNNANSSTIPPLTTGPVQFTPAGHRFSISSMPNPDLDLPSAEPSMMDIAPTIPERKHRLSPRPTMIAVPSNSPKLIRMRSQDLREAKPYERPSSIDRNPSMVSSRPNLEDSRIKREIPPERAAAAKARLEQRNAEKKKAQAATAGKENIRF